MERFAILLAGPVSPTPRLRAALAGCRAVAADGGIVHAGPLGLVPELWIGDFDSVPSGCAKSFAAVEKREMPRDKDQTDGQLAAEAAIARGASEILFVGALGGPRSDHVFSNLVLAMGLRERGLAVELFDGRERGWPLAPTDLRVDCAAGLAFSVLCFGDVEGLTLEGARWPLQGRDIAFGSVLTQSNETAGPIRASLRRGRALLLLQSGEGGLAP